jgi:hypothetical protein
MRVRRELAQLLRRLRAIRREKLPHGEVVARVGLALTQAGSLSRYVRLTRTDDDSGWRCHSCWGREEEPARGETVPSSAGAVPATSAVEAGCA